MSEGFKDEAADPSGEPGGPVDGEAGIELVEGPTHEPARVTPGMLARALLRDPITLAALVVLTVIVVAAIIWPLVWPYDHTSQALRMRNMPPLTPGQEPGDFPHILGTDPLGRDLVARLLSAARISLSVGFLGVIVSGAIGTAAGIVAGYYRGRVEDLIMRLVDLQMSIPFLLFALVALFLFGSGFTNVIIVLALVRWPLYARVSRSMAISLREMDYVESARSIGGGNFWILRQHILPNLLSPLVVLGTLEVARLILAESTLSFLGVGVQPPDSSWGLMISQGRDALRSAPWNVYLPGIFIFLSALSANLLATWLRAVTDPAQRWDWLLKRKKLGVGVAADASQTGQ